MAITLSPATWRGRRNLRMPPLCPESEQRSYPPLLQGALTWVMSTELAVWNIAMLMMPQ